MAFYALRGAITVDKNDCNEIVSSTKELLTELIAKNNLNFAHFVSIIFTGTKDLDAAYPAVAAREMGLTAVPLICCQEMHTVGSLEKCIRIMLHIQTEEKFEPRHIYLRNAVSLRPDLVLQNGQNEVDKKTKFSIAIDGPAGAGKSTIAKLIASKLNILYLDTGAMYRTVAFYFFEKGISSNDIESILSSLDNINVRVEYKAGQQRMYLNDVDVTEKIRTSEISSRASTIAIIPEVRLKLVDLQRKIASTQSLVADGRDIGTYVLPEADVKFYLKASIQERGMRRWKEINLEGNNISLESVIEDIKVRDATDSGRTFAPLSKATDAIEIDSTNLNVNEVLDEMLIHIKKKF